MQENKNEILKRGTEITQRYFEFLNQHIDDVVSGRVIEFMEINEIASALFLSHTHLTDTIQKETGNHPCYYYDLKIIDRAKELLSSSATPIAEIARVLTYDPSNFSKFFKKFVGKTPGQYRKNLKNKEA
ncbi:AraC family transcriptional regulator [Sphingobacterium sp. ML3W]|uniref:helix-turn-helix domain-containing protein n=1 Tax=Sphingobacterium sp. ML3W TaxID=1538644 RepID=UPI00249BD698|nr:AraC family transcriptional regulator [Sphingobacterium sp. ML3W]WFA79465.1 AraC family transcriptional regulator [Sphingobacterium sp. ML3W]